MKKQILVLAIIALLLTALAIPSFADTVSSGICAVGEVDATKAAVLLEDGSIKTVKFSGTAPTAGTVYDYTVDGSGVFSFTTAYLFNNAEIGQYPVGTGYDAWRIRDDNCNGDFFDADGSATTIVRLTEKTVCFVKFSDTSWRVMRGRNLFFFHADCCDWEYTTWPANIQAIYNAAGYMSLLYVDANNNNYLTRKNNGVVDDLANHVANANPLKILDPTGAGYTEGDKKVVIGGDKAPVYPNVCAVGEVNTEKGIAAILLPNGKVINAKYSGTAPTEDTVCTYTVSKNVYTFTAVAFPGFSNWRLYDNNSNSCFFNGADTYVPYTAHSVSFLKLGKNSWKVSTENPVIIGEGVGDGANTTWWSNTDAVDLNSDGTLDLLFADETAYSDQNPGKAPSLYINIDKTANDVIIKKSANTSDTQIAVVTLSVVAIASVCVISKRKKK